MDTGAGKMMHCTSLKPSSFKYPQKCRTTVADHWVPGIVVVEFQTLLVVP